MGSDLNWSFSELLFFIIFRKNRKNSKVNQQSVLNLYIFHHFPKILDRTISFNSVTLKNTHLSTEPQKYIIFFNETNKIKSRRIFLDIKFSLFFYFTENYSRRVRKSTNKKILALQG